MRDVQISEKQHDRLVGRRVIMLFFTIILLNGCIILRLLWLSGNGNYVAAAGSQSVYRLNVCTTRGTIYDCKMRPLAGGFMQYRACIVPSYSTKMHLRNVLCDKDYYAIERSLNKNSPFVLPVENGSIDGAGVEVVHAKVRYGAVTYAPHIVGYLGSDGHGVSGAEKCFDNYLSEQNGEITASYRVSANGRSLEGVSPEIFDSTEYSEAGIVLTIDIDLQQRVEEIAKKHLDRGAIVLMELPDGYIRACTSQPDFSPDDIAAALKAEHSPLVDRALCSYDIGSVFKLVTAAAALEAGISPDRKYRCEGNVEIGTNIFNCSTRSGHGEMDMYDALALSCNTYFIDLADEIGGQKIMDMARALGFGREIMLMDNMYTQSGCLPSDDVLSRPAGLANFSFGQGELLATPMHIARLTAAIANGGITVSPTLYEGRVNMQHVFTDRYAPTEGRRVMSAETASVLCEAMQRTVTMGTGKKGASPYVTSAAKTGTAQTGIKENGRRILQAWYAGFFPAERPRYVCIVLAEDGESGGATCGPIFREVAEAVMGCQK